jgi:hypothetical protein
MAVMLRLRLAAQSIKHCKVPTPTLMLRAPNAAGIVSIVRPVVQSYSKPSSFQSSLGSRELLLRATALFLFQISSKSLEDPKCVLTESKT